MNGNYNFNQIQGSATHQNDLQFLTIKCDGYILMAITITITFGLLH